MAKRKQQQDDSSDLHQVEPLAVEKTRPVEESSPVSASDSAVTVRVYRVEIGDTLVEIEAASESDAIRRVVEAGFVESSCAKDCVAYVR